ncbi:Retrovirus-related Pol polyprotein from transposon TNT 1-94 [Vitis vinifera]|uniref:Retrovirus-related Pol polyprotein from transposon TNT 1-94 n=1 Tax=Vitis vinifera TaxID=29760 RepID=A0A438CG90_VITVI|nr:Retrovirus-related Pol polyprotein from transposon TNT 1-94 [Vitis vinifera]
MVVRQRSSILRQALILISQPSNALTAIRLIPPIWISHNFKATTLGMTRKTMRNQGFEPWTFRSCLGYQHFVINDNNHDQRKKDSKKTSIATVAEIKIEANVAEKASALVAATDHGGKFLNTFTPVINSAWIIDSGATDHMTFDSRQVSPLRPSSQKIVSTANGNTTPVIREGSLTLTDTLNLDSVLVVPSLDYNLLSVSQITAALSCIVIFWPEFCVIKDIQTRQTIGCGIKRGKLYYLDLQSNDSNKLQQALMVDGSEGEKKKFGFCVVIMVENIKVLIFHSIWKDMTSFIRLLVPIHLSKIESLNGKNRHLLEVVRASLIAAKTLISYWGEAITSAAYLINRVPSNSINFQTPLQALTNAVVAPTVPNLPPRVFGCVAFVHLHKHQCTKLTSYALQCVFVGYALHKKRYRCYHPPTRQMYITMDVVFHEDSMYFSSEFELQGEYHKEIQTLDYDYHISEENESIQTLDYDYHIFEENESGQSELVNQEAGELDMSGQQFGSEDVFTEIPNQSSSVEGVLNLEPDPFMKRLPHRHNRECPPGKKPVGCRWIYTVKYKTDGSIERFKARLVAKWYTQTYGIDYIETFAPIAKINTVRVLLSLAANLDWPLQQFNVKNAFLHDELFEEVYMDLPPGCMVSEKQCQKVCKLKKSLYGLKQSPRAWFGRFTKSMRAFGYRQSNSDHTLFLKNNMETGMSGCQPVNTPIEEGLKLCVEPNQVSTDKGRYQRLVGRLMYLAHTKPDLAYALSVVSQYMHNPGEQHMNAVMRILRYLKNAPGKGILFAKNVNHQSIEVYTDADWAGTVDDRRSTSGYFTFVGGNLVTWKSKKQNVVARSSAEAEFRAACDIAHNPVQHDRTKHVEVDRFFIKEKLDDKIVELPKIRSEDQLTDILTKAVSSQVFSKFLDKLGMCDIYAPT